MFPKTVYHCSCVDFEIKLCLVNGHYSLKDICKKLNEKISNHKIYCSKCGDNLEDVIFSCREHMSLISGCELDNKKCLPCIKRYLKTAYDCCCYDYTSFDLPMSIKKEKKVLCLIIEKLIIE